VAEADLELSPLIYSDEKPFARLFYSSHAVSSSIHMGYQMQLVTADYQHENLCRQQTI